MILLNLPMPPSANRYYRVVNNRPILSQVAREYRAAIVALVGQSTPLEGRLSVTVHIYPGDNRRMDIDNRQKQLFDALQAAGIIKDDGQIDKLYIERKAVEKPGRVLVTIEEI